MISSGIYIITNLENGKTYVGSSKDIKRRCDQHRHALCRGNHYNPHLQYSWDKYGEKAFRFMVCEYVENLESLIKREQYWLDFHRLYVSVYNTILAVGRTSGMLGKEVSEETRRKISEANRDMVFTKEHRYKLSEAAKGRKHTEETKRKISEARKTQPPPRLNKSFSEEARRKISASNMGRSAWNKGKNLSEVHKRALSKAQKARWARVRAQNTTE